MRLAALCLLLPAALPAQSVPASPAAPASAAANRPAPAAAPQGPRAATPYTIYVSSESGDIVTRIEVGPEGWRRVREIPVGIIPTSPDGPHNVAVAPDGRSWYVSIAHGTPWGSVLRFTTGTDTLLGRVQVGMFPTTIGLSPDGDWAFVPNSDFHGDRGGRNTVSVLYTPDLTQLTEISTCDMPHGSRFNHAGSAVYIACMMSDELVVMDPSTFTITRRVALGSGSPMSMAEHQRQESARDSASAHAGHTGGAAPSARPAIGAASSTMPGQNPDCLTTYVSVSPDDRLIYLACNHSNEVQVRDAATLDLVRRLPTGNGAYNVEPSPDGRWLLVTNKKAQSVSVFETATWTERARLATSRRIPHGIAFGPDGRYAYVSQESVGADSGAVDVIDLATMARVASMAVPAQPTGLAIWRGH